MREKRSNLLEFFVFFRVVDGSSSVVKHDKKDKRHVKIGGT